MGKYMHGHMYVWFLWPGTNHIVYSVSCCSVYVCLLRTARGLMLAKACAVLGVIVFTSCRSSYHARLIWLSPDVSAPTPAALSPCRMYRALYFS